jgi:hypothetical protein
LLAANAGLRVLYLAPARLVNNVGKEFDRLGLNFRLWKAGEADARLSDPRIGANLHRAVHGDNFKKIVNTGPWDVIVVDECHHLSDWAAGGGDPVLKFRLVRDLLARQGPNCRLLLMSGTPHQGHTHRFDNLLRLLRREAEPENALAGRVEEALRNYHAADRGSALAEAIAKLEQKIIQLRARVDQNAINRKQEAVLDTISKTIRHYAEILGIEHFERPARIDIKNLMLVIEGPHGRRDHLWEIGSGANHMGYHIATLLALHEHFLSVSHNPAPQFLIVDQPSQAFFPEGWPPKSAQNKTGKMTKQQVPSDDIARVNRIFRALSEASVRTKNRLQIIVIDHTDEITWQGVGNVSVAQRWRGGDALIPRHWLKV